MKLRVYDNNGRERWVSLGQRVPQGWFDGSSFPVRQLDKDCIVRVGKEEGNPYDQYCPTRKVLYLEEIPNK
jgi:hypothetical protein